MTASGPRGFDSPPIRHTVRAIYVFHERHLINVVIRGLVKPRSHLGKHLSGLSVTRVAVREKNSHVTVLCLTTSSDGDVDDLKGAVNREWV